MKIFLDSANIDEIIEMLRFIDGVTTNPSLLKNWTDAQTIVNICGNKPVSIEVTEIDMIGQGKLFESWGDNVVVKLPCTQEGLECIPYLKKTNVTLVFTPAQALLASRMGAIYISPFIGRLEDDGQDAFGIIKTMKGLVVPDIWNEEAKTLILGASIRSEDHVIKCAEMDLDCITVPYKILKEIEIYINDNETTYHEKTSESFY